MFSLRNLALGIALSILVLPNVVHAAITFDASATASATSTNPLTWAHVTANQSSRVLIVACSISSSTGSAVISGITYNSVALSSIGNAGVSTPATDNVRVEMWKLAAPSTGSNTVSVTFSTGSGNFSCGSETWYGVDQVTVNRTASTRSGGVTSETSSSLTPTSAVGDMVIDAIGFRYTTNTLITASGSQTSRFNDGLVRVAGSSLTGAAGTTTMAWTWVNGIGSGQDSHIAVALIPASSCNGGLLLLGVGGC